MKTKIGAMLLAAVAIGCFSASARADDYYGAGMGCCGGGGGYSGWGVNRFYQSDRQIPYFAEHPPVYYSYPVPRTYGYSPYAYPGWVKTPEVRPAALDVINPHVPQENAPKKKKASQQTSHTVSNRQIEPLVVLNPYVTASEPVAASGN